MQNKRYKPLIDRMLYIVWVPTTVLLLIPTVLSVVNVTALIIMLAVDAFTYYFLVSSLIGYVELREKTVFIRFGFFLKREIPYERIRGVDKARKFYSESMLSLKNSFDHLNIRYNRFDIVCVSVVGNDELMAELEKRRSQSTEIS